MDFAGYKDSIFVVNFPRRTFALVRYLLAFRSVRGRIRNGSRSHSSVSQLKLGDYGFVGYKVHINVHLDVEIHGIHCVELRLAMRLLDNKGLYWEWIGPLRTNWRLRSIPPAKERRWSG